MMKNLLYDNVLVFIVRFIVKYCKYYARKFAGVVKIHKTCKNSLEE